MPHEVKPMLKMLRIPVIVAACAAAVYIIGSLTGAVIFNAGRYRELLTVESGDFQEDVDAISYNQIPHA